MPIKMNLEVYGWLVQCLFLVHSLCLISSLSSQQMFFYLLCTANSSGMSKNDSLDVHELTAVLFNSVKFQCLQFLRGNFYTLKSVDGKLIPEVLRQALFCNGSYGSFKVRIQVLVGLS